MLRLASEIYWNTDFNEDGRVEGISFMMRKLDILRLGDDYYPFQDTSLTIHEILELFCLRPSFDCLSKDLIHLNILIESFCLFCRCCGISSSDENCRTGRENVS